MLEMYWVNECLPKIGEPVSDIDIIVFACAQTFNR